MQNPHSVVYHPNTSFPFSEDSSHIRHMKGNQEHQSQSITKINLLMRVSLASHVQVAQLETYDPKLNQNKNHRISITKLYNSTQKLRRIETNFRLQHYSYSKNPIFH